MARKSTKKASTEGSSEAAKPVSKAAAKSAAKPTAKAAGKAAGKQGGKPADQMAAMEQFIRSRGQDYLSDHNINSIGIGFKTVAGKPTKELAIQFAVSTKSAQPQALGSQPIPQQITFNGVTFDTDVVERQFKPDYTLVASIDKDARKQRLDTISPGVSVGHPDTTAGTIGAIVLDKTTGSPVILSNWHVLNTPTGEIGDPIVQPGPFDDNRIDDNRIGVLLRSHLGLAGDCAIASLDGRQFDPRAFELGTQVGRVGKAELGDKVVKSGRTTGVTRGIVTRVSTVTRLRYARDIVEDIGGFEIGPDPDHPARGNEISKGGDSGACWMAIDGRGQDTDIVLGLHFGGDADDSDGEFSLAAQAHSVFEKLEIEPLPAAGAAAMQLLAARADAAPRYRKGFDASFLGEALPLPTFTDEASKDLASLDGDKQLRYCHFSVWLSQSRRLPRMVGWNIDGSSIKYLGRDNIDFRKDQRGTLANFQIGDELYKNNPFDRGHVARRADLCWGPKEEAEAANVDSFFFTNMTPQHERFNQSKLKGKWGELENAIFEEAEPDDLRVSLLAGPILGDDDPRYRRPELNVDVQIPVEFWKVVIFRDSKDRALALRGFILTQRDLVDDVVRTQTLELEEFRWFQVDLKKIGKETGVVFPSALAKLERKPAIQTLGASAGSARLIRTQADFFA